MSLFDEAGPVIDDLGARLIGERMPVVLYSAGAIMDSVLKETDGDPQEPEILRRLRIDLRDLFTWMVEMEADRLRSGVILPPVGKVQ